MKLSSSTCTLFNATSASKYSVTGVTLYEKHTING
jgi:hypothetical protein